ncbi:oligoendopeptidase, pepF/M3 family [Fictibacillus enclensis]|uniref:Oligoendopeptidase n=1 Tax=Fictibacillus enclensis TaxID=1017270 RepID=A0A0V8JFH6_9BACL|nr:M3 family oligoendopeptidase [Fictibacillus enclensis]KSU85843.1 oligoendopeptidase [Fictibacillus enclensis]SCC03693.1 oligoendopeptidase, pepF/M3 family [Fictibacillus enclensis]
MLLQGLRQSWDLESIFKGGSRSEELLAAIGRIEKQLADLNQKVESFQFSEEALQEVVEGVQQNAALINECVSFVGCLTAQDVNDKQALNLRGKLESLNAVYSTILVLLDNKMADIPDEEWNRVIQKPYFAAIAFPLSERRNLASQKLSYEQEALMNDLAVDGYHSWSTLYDTVVGKIGIEVEKDGNKETLSVGQAENRMTSPDREERESVFAKYTEAWDEQADFCAEALNHIAGFRNSVYKHRKWDNVLKEPLDINRMSEETLKAMWQAIEENKELFVTYLNRKASLLGVEKLSWADVDAPLTNVDSTMSYDEGASFIVEQFQSFSPKMSEFSKHAFEKQWIEAEDRSGKRPGGFCTGFPVKNETRIFMTYSGTPSNVSTLAHELGHAFHSYVMDDMPFLATDYAMNVAETASTFAEMVVSDAAVKNAKSKEEKIALLEDKAQRSVAFFMNIHARFLFETRFYEERKQGLVPVERLKEFMVEAQKEAFCDSLGSYHPYFWASKLHFYITDVPFYNFPYTFGYLFSASIYAIAKQEGTSFEEKYIALLRDTASMTVEELAMKHLNEDVTKPEFWKKGIEVAIKDVKEFLELTQD